MRISLLVVTALCAAAEASAQSCDRECLRSTLTAYLDALVKHDPGALSLAPNVRFTEDNTEKQVGEGFWKTASKLGTYRQDFLDVRQSTAIAFVIVEEDAKPVMHAVRLKLNPARQISEMETMVVRNQAEGMIFEPAALEKASPAMNAVPTRAQLNTREEMIGIAMRYPAGLKIASFVKSDAPFAPEAYRFENGRLMAGPGCTFIPGCQDIRGQRLPLLAEIRARAAAVDEEAGIVVVRMDFGKGSTFGGDNSLNVWEAFKIYGGQIHAVEAFMEQMPLGMLSGWDSQYPWQTPAVQ